MPKRFNQNRILAMELKEILIKEIEREVHILKGLYKKLEDVNLDFRPNPSTRSLRELLEYIKVCALPTLLKYSYKDLDKLQTVKREYEYQLNTFEESDYSKILDWQFEKIKFLLVRIPDEQLETDQVTIWKDQTMSLFTALLNTTVKYFTAYRMQLFLYLKMAGQSTLNSQDCWVGTNEVLKD